MVGWKAIRQAGAGVAAALLVTTLGAGCGDDDGGNGNGNGTGTPGPGGDRLTEPVTLSVATLPSLSLGPLWLANERGYFEDEMLTVELETVQSSQDAVSLLARGQLDVITGSMSVGLFNSIESGLDIRAVSSVSTIAEVPGVDETPSGVFLRADLAESGTASYEDLRGRTIAAPGGLGASVSYLVGLYAEQGGFTLEDVELENLGIADSVLALEQGAVDAAFLTSPFSTQALESGAGVEVGSAREIYGDETQSALLYGPNLLRDNQVAGVAFLRAMLRAAADLQGDYRTDDSIVSDLSAAMDIPVETIESAPPYHFPADLAMNPATVEQFQQMFLDLGGNGDLLTYDEPLPLDRVLDDSLLQRAMDSSS